MIRGIVDRGPVVDVAAAPHGEVGGLEQLEGGPFEGALGQDEAEHAETVPERAQPSARRPPSAGPVDGRDSRRASGSWRSRSTISMAVWAASKPLLPALVPARSMACSMVSVREHPEDDRHAGVELGPLDAGRALAGDQVVVAGGTPDDRAQGDDGVELAAGRQLAGDQGQLEGARAPRPP